MRKQWGRSRPDAMRNVMVASDARGEHVDMVELWIARGDAWSLCRRALREICGRVPEIRKTALGKPVAKGVYFSVSHARELVVVCASLDRDVGVDVEPIASGVRVLRIGDLALTRREVARAPGPIDASKLWACNEATIKAFGARLGEVDPAKLGFRIDGRRAHLESRALGRASPPRAPRRGAGDR